MYTTHLLICCGVWGLGWGDEREEKRMIHADTPGHIEPSSIQRKDHERGGIRDNFGVMCPIAESWHQSNISYCLRLFLLSELRRRFKVHTGGCLSCKILAISSSAYGRSDTHEWDRTRECGTWSKLRIRANWMRPHQRIISNLGVGWGGLGGMGVLLTETAPGKF